MRYVRRLVRPLTVAAVLGCAALLAWTPSYPNVRLLTDALIMDATTFPVPSPGFMESAINDFIAPATGTDPATYIAVPVRQPSRLLGINEATDEGAEALLDALDGRTGPVVVFGFSQSTATQAKVKAELEARRNRGETVPDVTFVGIGTGNRPNGSITQRFAGITIPFFDFTFDGAGPHDTGFDTIDIARQYDGLADLTQFPINVVSTANAILGVLFVHALYGEEVSLDPQSPKYVPGTVVQQDGDTTYYWIPTADLPLLDPVRLLGVPEAAIDIVEPFFKVLVEAGYDRSIPFGEPTPAQLIPVIDPVTLAIQLVTAVVEGANNAAAIVGGQLPGYDALKAQLGSAQAWAASTIGAPYRDVVRAINEAFNPFEAFGALTGPPAKAIGSVLNPLVVRPLSRVVDPLVAAFTGWAEANVLFPTSAPTPLAGAVIQFLRRVAPHLATPAPQSSETATFTPVNPAQADEDQASDEREPASPSPLANRSDAPEADSSASEAESKSEEKESSADRSDAEEPKSESDGKEEDSPAEPGDVSDPESEDGDDEKESSAEPGDVSESESEDDEKQSSTSHPKSSSHDSPASAGDTSETDGDGDREGADAA